jgi:hypothetical protein
MSNPVMNMWSAPKIKGTLNLRSLVGAAVASSVVFTVILAVCTLLAANASAFGTWGPIIGAAATLVVSILQMLNLGTPVPPVPTITSNEVHALEWKAVPKEEVHPKDVVDRWKDIDDRG